MQKSLGFTGDNKRIKKLNEKIKWACIKRNYRRINHLRTMLKRINK